MVVGTKTDPKFVLFLFMYECGRLI